MAFHSMAAGSLQFRLLRMRVLHGGILILQKQKVMQALCQEFRTRDPRRMLARGSAARGVTRFREDRRRNRPPLHGVHLPAPRSKLGGRLSLTNRSVIVPYICQFLCSLFAGSKLASTSFACFFTRLSDRCVL